MFLISVYLNLIILFNRNSSFLLFYLADFFTPYLHLLDTAAMTEMQGARLISEFLFLLEISSYYFLARGQSVLMLAFSEI